MAVGAASRDGGEISNAAFFVHGLGERARSPIRRPSGTVGCASRPTCRRSHRPAAALFSTQPAGARADAPEAGALPGTRALSRHWRGGDDRPRASGSGQLRRSRADFVAELGTSFDGGWCGLAGCGRNFECRAFRAGWAHSISQRVRMSEGARETAAGSPKGETKRERASQHSEA
jgi:hypothetical protein